MLKFNVNSKFWIGEIESTDPSVASCNKHVPWIDAYAISIGPIPIDLKNSSLDGCSAAQFDHDIERISKRRRRGRSSHLSDRKAEQ
jgi:hypothetical protein